MVNGPLAGIRILEFGGFGPAPLGATMLADMGADVIRIDRITAAPLEEEFDLKLDITRRSRRCVALDLRSPTGVELALRLIEKGDGVIEPYRPGVMERLGLGPDVCLERNPRLVYGRVTGWGQEGEWAQRAGHDLTYAAVTGALHAIAGRHGPPTPPLNYLCDGAGGMLLAFGMVSGLWAAKHTGTGQVVDSAMVDAASLLFAPFMASSVHGRWGPPGSNLIDGGAHFYNVYETADGKFVSVAAIEPQFYAELVERLGLDMHALPPQMDQSTWPVMKRRFEELFRSRTRDEWCRRLDSGDSCFAPVLQASEALEHPHAIERDAYEYIAGVPHPTPAPRFSVSGSRSPSEPRPRGADTVEVLQELGISPAEIEGLQRSGAVLQA